MFRDFGTFIAYVSYLSLRGLVKLSSRRRVSCTHFVKIPLGVVFAIEIRRCMNVDNLAMLVWYVDLCGGSGKVFGNPQPS